MNKTTAIASLGIALAAIAAACGGSVSATSTGTSGTGGAGTSTATATGTGAMTTSSASTSASSSSGEPTCPAAAPGSGAACTAAGEECTYSGGSVVCDCGGPADMLVWLCRTCPATQPAGIDACAGQQGDDCTYGATTCTCSENVWICGTCPATAPTNGSGCVSMGVPRGLDCRYTGAECTCESFAGPAGGGGTRWDCGLPCPAAEPAPGAACEEATLDTCVYGATSCLCTMAAAGQPTTWACY